MSRRGKSVQPEIEQWLPKAGGAEKLGANCEYKAFGVGREEETS